MSGTPQFEGCQVTATLQTGAVTDLYEAIQQPLGRHVLVKALSSSILPSSPFAATLEREAQLLAALEHPNVLRVHDFVRRDDQMWLVLEHIPGWTLEELISQQGRLAPALVAAVALEVALALEHAHRKGIIHRDIQPMNVMVGQDGTVKLAHFSVAVNERLPSLPELLDGSAAADRIAYMSPEQILGERPDPRSDLFSLGVTMYQALSGKWPSGDGNAPTTQRIRHQSPVPLGRLVSNIPGSLERAVHRCLQKVAADRFSSAQELVVALQTALRDLGEPSARLAISRALLEAGLVDKVAATEPPPPSLAAPREPRSKAFRSAFVGNLFAFVLIAVGSTTLFAVSKGSDVYAFSRAGGGRLDLVPKGAAQLRVVAEPWAHVVVDGHHVDTTPFARPIPLRAGTHYVRLEHPHAPTERRTVRLVSGETVLLDVKMRVRHPRPQASKAEEEGPPDDDSP